MKPKLTSEDIEKTGLLAQKKKKKKKGRVVDHRNAVPQRLQRFRM